MNNDLHMKITKDALSKVRTLLPTSASAVDLASVEIDLLDTLPRTYEGNFYSMNHDSPGAQYRHFMRNKDQTNEEARNRAVAYIKEQAALAATTFINENRTTSRTSQLVCEVGVTAIQKSYIGQASLLTAAGGMAYKGQKEAPKAILLRQSEIPQSICTASWPLGLAAHTLEDSFSPSHVVRQGNFITSIQVYAQQDHDDHDLKDASTENYEKAVQAVADLFLVVRKTTMAKSPSLLGWEAFESTWLTLKTNNETTPQTYLAASGSPVTKQKPLAMAGVTAGGHYIVKSGDSLGSIAGAYYKDMLLWPHIYDHNQKIIRNPNNIRRGTILNIPEAPKSADIPALRARGRNWRSYNLI